MTAPNQSQTGRRRRNAVSDEWLVEASCRETDPEAFFSKAQAEVDVARSVCANCPVIVECLLREMGREEALYRWGVVGGLSHEQRRALYAELLLGGRPDMRMARWLASPWARARLLGAWEESGHRLSAATGLLRAEGLLVTEVTVRLALWWSGEKASRLTTVPSGDSQARAARMAAEERLVMRQLREKGATTRDVAAYLGAAEYTTMAAFRLLAAADRQEVAA